MFLLKSPGHCLWFAATNSSNTTAKSRYVAQKLQQE
jgi:hypothetical protein